MKRNSILNIIGIVIGLCILTAGIICFLSPADHYHTVTVDDAAFGGDFYTEIYSAVQTLSDNTAVAANNIRELGESLAFYFGAILSSIGVLTIFHSIKQIVLEEERKKCTQLQDV